MHVAAANEASVDIVRLLLAAYPEGTTRRDQDGEMPLHVAAANEAPAEV